MDLHTVFRLYEPDLILPSTDNEDFPYEQELLYSGDWLDSILVARSGKMFASPAESRLAQAISSCVLPT